jgi:hypothetical protein
MSSDALRRTQTQSDAPIPHGHVLAQRILAVDGDHVRVDWDVVVHEDCHASLEGSDDERGRTQSKEEKGAAQERHAHQRVRLRGEELADAPARISLLDDLDAIGIPCGEGAPLAAPADGRDGVHHLVGLGVPMAPRVPALAREALVLLADRFGATDRNQSAIRVHSENAIRVQSEFTQRMQSDAIRCNSRGPRLGDGHATLEEARVIKRNQAQSSVIRSHLEDGHATLEEARAIGAHHDVVVPGREAREQT